MPKLQRTFSDLPLEVAQDPKNRQSEVRQNKTSVEADFEMLRERLNDTLALRLLHGYRLGGVQTLCHFGLEDRNRGGASLPSSIPSLAECIERFSDEDLELLDEYQKPTFVIRPPGKDYKDLIGALAYHYHEGVQTGPVVSELNSITWGSDNEYRPFIVEAVCNMQPKKDMLSQPLGGRIARKRELIQSGEYAMTGEIYMLLAMQSIVRGQMIDQQTFTVLDGEIIVADRYVATGQCRDKQPSIDWIPIECEASRGRFRRVLRGSRG